MATDGDGAYGFAEVTRPSHKWVEEAAKALSHIKQMFLGCPVVRIMTTVPRTVSSTHGELRFTTKPAPTGIDIQGHGLAKKMLHLIGITDLLLNQR